MSQKVNRYWRLHVQLDLLFGLNELKHAKRVLY